MSEQVGKIRPLAGKLIVERDQAKHITKGGILLPDVAKEIPVRGTVVAVGLGKRQPDGSFDPAPVEVGERVLFLSYAGNRYTQDGRDLLIMDYNEVIAVDESGE